MEGNNINDIKKRIEELSGDPEATIGDVLHPEKYGEEIKKTKPIDIEKQQKTIRALYNDMKREIINLKKAHAILGDVSFAKVDDLVQELINNPTEKIKALDQLIKELELQAGIENKEDSLYQEQMKKEFVSSGIDLMTITFLESIKVNDIKDEKLKNKIIEQQNLIREYINDYLDYSKQYSKLKSIMVKNDINSETLDNIRIEGLTVREIREKIGRLVRYMKDLGSKKVEALNEIRIMLGYEKKDLN